MDTILSEHLRIPKDPIVLKLSDFYSKRLIVIGDVHGCLDELVELMDKLDVQHADIIVFLGDLIDRGPKSPEVVAYIKYLCEHRIGTFCILGNHDEKAVRHRRHELKVKETPGYRNPMKVHENRLEEYGRLDDEECLWLAKLPHVIELMSRRGVRLMTHAGLIEGFGTRQPTSGLIRNRYLRRALPKGASGQQVRDLGWEPAPCVRGARGEMKQPPNAVEWAEIWTGARVVYGHAVHDLHNPRVLNDCWGVDTGVCFGGRLTAYVEDLDTAVVSFVQVPAKKVYENPDTSVVE